MKDAATKDTSKTAKPEAATTTSATAPRVSAGQSDAKVWENYDFVPGNKVLFYTDSSDDRVAVTTYLAHL